MLTVEGLSLATRSGTVLVDDVDLRVDRGETVGLVGESGAGKSLTSLAVMRLLPRNVVVSSGSVRLGDDELLDLSPRGMADVRGSRVAMIFQEPMSSLNPAYRVGEQIAETLRRHRGLSRRAARLRAVELLGLVGIPGAAERAAAYPHAYSGGMRQRAMIAMALSCDPELLIADEPTTALDVTIQAQIIELLRDVQERFGMGLVFVTHDLAVVADLCDRVAVMYAGQIVETAERDPLFTAPRHPYSAGLLACTPRGSRGDRMPAIDGTVPPPDAMPPGCRFAPRCPHALQPRCTAKVPELRRVRGHEVRCVRAEELALEGVGA